MKKLLTLFIGLFSIISFGYCFNLSSEQIEFLDKNSINSGSFYNQGTFVNLYDYGNETNNENRNLCVIFKNFYRNSDFGYRVSFISTLTTSNNGYSFGTTSPYTLFCATGRRRYFALSTSSSNNKFSADNFRVISPSILFSIISDLNTCNSDINTCENDLLQCQDDLINCGEGNTPSCESGDIQWSSLFINDIQHESTSNINITIPEEIERDYTNEDDEFDLTVNGYNVDNEYISQIIENEKITPTADDFSYLIENLGSYIPLLCIAGLMITARYIIKKIF